VLGVRRKTALDKADRIVAENLKRLRWTEADLRRDRESDPEELRIAVRLRRETIWSFKKTSAPMDADSKRRK